jgi:hypothetical protein
MSFQHKRLLAAADAHFLAVDLLEVEARSEPWATQTVGYRAGMIGAARVEWSRWRRRRDAHLSILERLLDEVDKLSIKPSPAPKPPPGNVER